MTYQDAFVLVNLAKTSRRPANSQLVTNTKEMVLREDCTTPGIKVHTDQYESSVGGRLLTSFGKEK